MANTPESTKEVGDLTGPVDIFLTQSAALSLTFYFTDTPGQPIPLDAMAARFVIYSPASQQSPPQPTTPDPNILLDLNTADDPASLSISGNALSINLTEAQIEDLAPQGSEFSSTGHQIYIWPIANPAASTRIMAGRVSYSLSPLTL